MVRLGALWTRLRDPQALLAIAVDATLVGAGLATAVGSVTFAGFMLAQSEHQPDVYGQKYLAIYAQPRKAAKPEPSAAPPVFGGIDMAPVGSIGAPTPSDAPPPRREATPAPTDVTPLTEAPIAPNAAGVTLVGAQPGIAWLREGSRIVAVRVGDIAPGLGRIAAIVQREGRWRLLGETGSALLSSDSPAAKNGPPASAPFNRRMIFGDEK